MSQKKPDLYELHKDIHLYYGEAVAATGYLTLPVQEVMEMQGAVGLAMGGGHTKSRVDNFHHHHIFSFRSAHSEVSGRSSAKKKSRNTLSQVVIEGLNIHNVVTCDRIVSRVAVHKPDDGGEMSIIPFGSTIDNLRIGGFPVNPKLAIDWFTEHDTYDKFLEFRSKNRPAVDKTTIRNPKEKEIPEPKEVFACTLVKEWGPLPPGVEEHGHGLWVPEFGMVYIGEFFVSKMWRRLRMFRTVLGCGSEGCYGGGNTGGGGAPWP